MNLFRRSTHSIYRTVAERLWTTSEGDEEGALGTSQQALNAKIAVKPVGQFRHRWRQMRSSTVLALVAVALCGILVCIYRKCGFKHMTDANLGGVAQQDQTSSDGGYVIPLTPSPIIGLLDGMAPLEDNDYYPRVRSALGLVAERSYVQGPRTLDDYRSSLATFIDVAMPEDLRPTLQSGLTRYTSNRDSTLYLKNEYNRLAGVGEDASTRRIWQINSSPDYITSETAASWKNNGEGWEWKHLNDTGGSIYVREHLKGSRLNEVWNLMPNGCLVSDIHSTLSNNKCKMELMDCFSHFSPFVMQRADMLRTLRFCFMVAYSRRLIRNASNRSRNGKMAHRSGKKVVAGCMPMRKWLEMVLILGKTNSGRRVS